MMLLTWRNLRYRRVRAWLTVLGIVIGTTMILELNFLGDGMRRAVTAQLESFGSDLVFVFPGKENNPFVGMAGGLELRNRDVQAIRDVDGVRVAVPMQLQTVRMDYDGEELPVIMHGAPWQEMRSLLEGSRGFRIADGDWPSRDDALEVMLGAILAAERFRRPIVPGDAVVIRGRRYEVVGVFAPTGDTNDDTMAYLSQERFRRITGSSSGVGSVAVRVAAGYEPADVAAAIKSRLLKEKGIEDFVVLTAAKALDIVGGILGVIQLVLGGIAAVALLVGGVGIMNSMFTAVLERTREIGVLKALGATDRRILSIFLVEAGLLGAVGGAVGVGLSAGIAYLVEFAARRKGFVFLDIAVEPRTVLLALAFTFAVGMVFGAVPAWQASRLKPTEALRYE